jgi:hypothetical protein
VYAYLLPAVLYAAWVAIALWDLARSNRRKLAVVVWFFVVLLVPFFGVLAFYAFGKSAVPAWKRALFVFGGLGALLLVLAVGALAGGIV